MSFFLLLSSENLVGKLTAAWNRGRLCPLSWTPPQKRNSFVTSGAVYQCRLCQAAQPTFPGFYVWVCADYTIFPIGNFSGTKRKTSLP